MTGKALYVIILIFGYCIGAGVGQITVQDQIQEAYRSLAEYSDKGGDISSLVSELNKIIIDIEDGEYDASEISNSLNEIIQAANSLIEKAETENTLEFVLTSLNLVVVMILGYIIWMYFPAYYWRLWLRYRGHWLVK